MKDMPWGTWFFGDTPMTYEKAAALDQLTKKGDDKPNDNI